jgi:3-deoxy-D-manno-octulosonic-acid transferase
MLYYDVLIAFLSLGSIPKLLWDRWKKKKKNPTLLERFGWRVPESQGKSVIWIHAVSVGEAKAAQPLFRKLRDQYPNSFFLITTGTATGGVEAKRSLPEADAFFFLPLDFSFVMRRWVKALRPTHFILIESDFWFHLLLELKKQKTFLVLASGKISEKSAARFRFFSFFAKKIFGLFDLFCVQSKEYASRFAPFVPHLYVTGNLKFDLEPNPIDATPWQDLCRPNTITIASTHAPEEEALLRALKPLFPDLFVFLAPRHPERVDAVEKIIQELQIPFIRWSQIAKRQGHEVVVLIDSMGQLPICYKLSKLAIVAGSFTDKVGGHNLVEPCLYGCPSLFGPFTYSQAEFTRLILEKKAGLQISLSAVEKTVSQILKNASVYEGMKRFSTDLFSANRGATNRTIFLIAEKEFANKGVREI